MLIKTLRVLPNPWTDIHVDPAPDGRDKGPQGLCTVDNGGRETAPLAYLGARYELVRSAKFAKGDPREDTTTYAFSYPSLNETLTGAADDQRDGIPVPAGSAYYRDRLRDGGLVPADETTAGALDCMFKSMAEARAAGIANFEAHHGPGSFAAMFPHLADKSAPPAAATTKKTAAPAADGGKP